MPKYKRPPLYFNSKPFAALKQPPLIDTQLKPFRACFDAGMDYLTYFPKEEASQVCKKK